MHECIFSTLSVSVSFPYYLLVIHDKNHKFKLDASMTPAYSPTSAFLKRFQQTFSVYTLLVFISISNCTRKSARNENLPSFAKTCQHADFS